MTRGLTVATLVVAILALVSCSRRARTRPPAGRIVVALTLDWEGIELSAEGMTAVERMREQLGGVPVTHFVSSAYATKTGKEDVLALAGALARMVHTGDELAVHLHAWRSLAAFATLDAHLAPSFLSGTDGTLEFEGDDAGFDTDLDAYDVPALRALLRTSRAILEHARPRTAHVSTSFRAGGYLGTPKVLLALGDEGFTVDASAVDINQLQGDDPELPRRLAQVWPRVDSSTQPFLIRGGGMQSLVEMPIAAVVDYVTTDVVIQLLAKAEARLRNDPARDQYVVLAFHLETATDFASHLADAFAKARAEPGFAADVVFTTLDEAAERARFALQPVL
ncbi:hypothetical protein BH11MYX1_BH11MYX1_01290 [soil metagenome]